ncbi:MAG: GNAT family N-acetyltransferase [Anaerolineae bacterium]|nr:GNAT family N-acetyltransferase [Anaerolineae bacterium]MDW8172132.1 GNAT family N-acetyltransferase [Anaerolineae bacterium]
MELLAQYPKTLSLNGIDYTLRPMQAGDRDVIVRLAQYLPESDMAFIGRDITNPEAVDEWLQDNERGHSITLLVEEGERIIAYGSLQLDNFYWSRHIGEIRLLVAAQYRNRGLGQKIVRELMSLARDAKLHKAIIYIASDDRAARRMLEGIGWQAEAMLADWVMMRDGRTKDLLIMAVSLNEIKG